MDLEKCDAGGCKKMQINANFATIERPKKKYKKRCLCPPPCYHQEIIT